MSSNRAVHSTGRRATAYAAALLAALGALASGPATGAAAPPDSAAARSTAPTRVTLPTGDTVLVGSAAGTATYWTVAADPSGITGSFSSVSVGGDQYVLPAEVKPLLGSLVDPSLFDVTALAKQGGPATVVATVTSASASVPGLTVTKRSGTTLTGYVAASGAAAFRDALVRAATAVSAGKAPTSFPGVTRLAGTAAGGVVTPDYPQVALNIAVTPVAGEPAPSGFLLLVNTDDARRYNGFVFVRKGKARVSVPLGHYSGLVDVFDIAPDGNSGVVLDVPISDYTVRQDQQTMTFDLATATVEPTVSLPRPADVESTSITWNRLDAKGHGGTSFSSSTGGFATMKWAPAPPAQHGEEDWVTGFHADGGTAEAPYTYDLSFATRGYVPSEGHHDVTDAQLATIDASYFMDQPSDSAFGFGAYYLFLGGYFTELLPLQTPAEVTEYVNDDPGVYWSGAFIGNGNDVTDVVDEFGGRHYDGGTTVPVDWLRGPLAPTPSEDPPGGPGFLGCSACRTARAMDIVLTPYTDTEPGHYGETFNASESALRATLSVDGRRISGSRGYLYLHARVPSDAHHYDVHVRVNRVPDGDTLSTETVTDYGFTSSATTGVPWPSDGYCYLVPRDPSACRTVGMLRVTAPLPTDLSRRMPVGASSFTLGLAPYGDASGEPITSADVGVSLDGRTFTPAAVTRVDDQHFQVTLDNPAAWAGQPVTLRISATDANGDTITQTTTAAYAVAGS